MEEGETVSLTGVVRAGDSVLRAPLTGQPCVLHVSRARIWTQLDWAGDLVDTISLQAAVAFTLETTDGEILIDPEHRVVKAPVQPVVPPHDGLRDFLAPRGLERYAGSTFAEHALVAPGDRVEIRGIALREARAFSDGEQGYRDAALRFKLVGYPRRRLEIVRVG